MNFLIYLKNVMMVNKHYEQNNRKCVRLTDK